MSMEKGMKDRFHRIHLIRYEYIIIEGLLLTIMLDA
jgi:hypothetical protein